MTEINLSTMGYDYKGSCLGWPFLAGMHTHPMVHFKSTFGKGSMMTNHRSSRNQDGKVAYYLFDYFIEWIDLP